MAGVTDGRGDLGAVGTARCGDGIILIIGVTGAGALDGITMVVGTVDGADVTTAISMEPTTVSIRAATFALVRLLTADVRSTPHEEEALLPTAQAVLPYKIR